MPVSIVTFANLGKKSNLKTSDIVPVIDAFSDAGELRQVICQLHSGFPFPHTYAAIPAYRWYPLRLWEKLSGRPLARQTMERLFDSGAARTLTQTDATFFHGGYFLPKTASRAGTFGSIRIDIPVSAHVATNARLEAEELQMLGIDDYDGWYVRLAREDTHSNAFEYVIALSDFVQDSYIASGFPPERISVAAPDIDTERFSPAPNPHQGTFRVVYAAYTAQLKGLHYLLDAWEQLALPDAELAIVGGYGDMPEALKERYDAIIARNPSITWVGPTPTPEEEYRRSSLLVFPSLTEGFGRVTLEAMACGIPVITTENARGIVEDGKTGFVVPIRDVAALKEKIEYLYRHPDIAVQMGTDARAAVERKKPFGEAVYALYEEIMARERAGSSRATLQEPTSANIPV
ncbi:MAG: hypothetical protein JWO84_746 [Parcubacteria group bacterium]|nr:hypothetical protein [Parcubacteria group bacterium]